MPKSFPLPGAPQIPCEDSPAYVQAPVLAGARGIKGQSSNCTVVHSAARVHFSRLNMAAERENKVRKNKHW